MLDYLIKNVQIIDGSGAESFTADVGIEKDKIAAVGNLPDAGALSIIDGTGMTLTPGFIDVHGHGDISSIANPQTECKIRQGITTQVVGQCGAGPYPLMGSALEQGRREMAELGLELDWTDAAGYFERLEKTSPATNMLSMLGHGTLRESVMGEKDEAPSPEQMKQMKRLVEESMDAGAAGISTGLIYIPGYFADEKEISELAKVAAGKGGFYCSHIRGEGDNLLNAVEEALKIGEDSGAAVQVSHLKASAPRNWGKVKDAINMIEEARDRGLDVAFDKYPYTAGSTGLVTDVPRWAVGEGTDKALEYLRDPQTRKKIFDEANEINEGADKWASVIIISAESERFAPYEGKSVADIAKETGLSLMDTFSELLIESRLGAEIVCFTQSQDDTDLALTHPLGLVCTDSGVWAPYGPLSRIKPHPRAYGTFPRFINRYVREMKALSAEEAVHKATGLSARRFKIKNRGLVKEGYFADLLLIDWDNLKDTASYTDPHQYPQGIEKVWVNGCLTISEAKQSGVRKGRVLRLRDGAVG